MESQRKKCSEHKDINANIYCKKCEIYMCNKCETHHTKLFKTHQSFILNPTSEDIYNNFVRKKHITILN